MDTVKDIQVVNELNIGVMLSALLDETFAPTLWLLEVRLRAPSNHQLNSGAHLQIASRWDLTTEIERRALRPRSNRRLEEAHICTFEWSSVATVTWKSISSDSQMVLLRQKNPERCSFRSLSHFMLLLIASA
jgi:hypothetical protein